LPETKASILLYAPLIFSVSLLSYVVLLMSFFLILKNEFYYHYPSFHHQLLICYFMYIIIDYWICFQVLHYLPASLVHRRTQGFHRTAVKVGDLFVFTFKTHRLLLFLQIVIRLTVMYVHRSSVTLVPLLPIVVILSDKI
jgi:hypothetical protein